MPNTEWTLSGKQKDRVIKQDSTSQQTGQHVSKISILINEKITFFEAWTEGGVSTSAV